MYCGTKKEQETGIDSLRDFCILTFLYAVKVQYTAIIKNIMLKLRNEKLHTSISHGTSLRAVRVHYVLYFLVS